MGIFISPDSIEQDWNDPQMFNRYAYTKNNQLKYTDPSGHNLVGMAIGICAGAFGGSMAGLQNGGNIGSALAGGAVGAIVGGLVGLAAPTVSGPAASATVGTMAGFFGGLFGGQSGRGATATLDAIENGDNDPLGKGLEAALDFELGQSLSDAGTGAIAGFFGGLTGNATVGVHGSQAVTAITTGLFELPANLLGNTILGIVEAANDNSSFAGNGGSVGMAVGLGEGQVAGPGPGESDFGGPAAPSF